MNLKILIPNVSVWQCYQFCNKRGFFFFVCHVVLLVLANNYNQHLYVQVLILYHVSTILLKSEIMFLTYDKCVNVCTRVLLHLPNSEAVL